MSKSRSERSSRSNRYQRGEAEIMLFGIAVVVAILISGSVWLLTWIRQTKDGKVLAHHEARMAKRNKGTFLPRQDPAQYYVQCNGSLLSPTKISYPCEVLPESYGELYIDTE